MKSFLNMKLVTDTICTVNIVIIIIIEWTSDSQGRFQKKEKILNFLLYFPLMDNFSPPNRLCLNSFLGYFQS